MLHTRVRQELAPELLYNIVAYVCVEYIDDYYDLIVQPDDDEDNPIVSLLRVSHRVRDITRKVINDTLRTSFQDQLWPVKPRWLLESLRQQHSFILLSLNLVQPSPHTLRVDAYGDSMFGETALSSTYAYLAVVKLMLNCVTVSGTSKEMDAIEKAFQYVWNSFDQIKPTILRSKVRNRLVDFSEQIGDVRELVLASSACTAYYDELLEYPRVEDHPNLDKVYLELVQTCKNVRDRKFWEDSGQVSLLQRILRARIVRRITKVTLMQPKDTTQPSYKALIACQHDLITEWELDETEDIDAWDSDREDEDEDENQDEEDEDESEGEDLDDDEDEGLDEDEDLEEDDSEDLDEEEDWQEDNNESEDDAYRQFDAELWDLIHTVDSSRTSED